MAGIDLDITLQLAGFKHRIDLVVPLSAHSFFGPSGAGTSTLLRVISGLTPGTERVVFAGDMWEGGGYFVPLKRDDRRLLGIGQYG